LSSGRQQQQQQQVTGCEFADGKGMQTFRRQQAAVRRQSNQEVSSCLCQGLRVGVGVGLTNKMAL